MSQLNQFVVPFDRDCAFPEACEFLFVDILPRQFVVGFSRQDGQQMVAVIGGLDSWNSPMNPWLLWKGYPLNPEPSGLKPPIYH